MNFPKPSLEKFTHSRPILSLCSHEHFVIIISLFKVITWALTYFDIVFIRSFFKESLPMKWSLLTHPNVWLVIRKPMMFSLKSEIPKVKPSAYSVRKWRVGDLLHFGVVFMAMALVLQDVYDTNIKKLYNVMKHNFNIKTICCFVLTVLFFSSCSLPLFC